MYFDFLQKQKVAKIVKLRRDQASLPMASHRMELLSCLSENQVVVVAGDTGCGKSTQVPQYLYLPPEGSFQCIAVTQPRRIACISLAARVSTEMLSEKESKVGYQVRFERSRTKATRILFLTEGLLLRQMQMDPFLKDYDALVLDEIHERHWQTDCLLGLVKLLVRARPKLRVVLMSATINVNLFSSFFNNCPIIQVPGRLFPIELNYMPLTPNEAAQTADRLDPSPYIRLLQRIDARYPASERGDVLVFLPGMADIQAVMEPAKEYAEQTKRWIILPLHSTLSADDQEKVFHVAPDGVRKCVLSTNIAETSLTIDGIRFVADSGRAKELSWDASARMRRLKEFPISKASANQRKGRAGRTGPGVCFRFYSQEDYDNYEAFSTPEIRRVPLETLALQMIVMGLPDLARFPFIEAPEPKSLEEALERLQSHGALSKAEQETSKVSTLQVTPLGCLLADLPVEFTLGRMLILASLLGLVEPVLTLVSGTAVQSPLMSATAFTGHDQVRRMEALGEFESDHGDAFTVMNVFDEWIKLKSEATFRDDDDDLYRSASGKTAEKTQTNTRRWCRRIGAQEQRMHEMVRLRHQFSKLLRDAGLWGSQSTSSEFKALGTDKRRDLNRARRTERMRTKRRRLLTLQDGNATGDQSNSDGDDDRDGSTRELRRWVAGATTQRSGTVDASDVPVRDLELVLCYDLSSLAEYATHHGHMTRADVVLLKVVLAGGLYPHVAVADPANAYRVANRGRAAGAGAEMVFHTRAKGFITLHPNDVFVRNPDVLFPDSKQSADMADASTEKQTPLPTGYACNHQLIMYLDLMETTKPFLVNTLRVPALSTLLLYGREVDTNSLVTRIVFDSWIEVSLLDVEAAQRALSTAVWLRALMDQLMELRLAESSRHRDQMTEDAPSNTSTNRKDEMNSETRRQCSILQRVLSHGLVAFLAGNPGGPHTLRRLLAADVKQLFRKRRETLQGHLVYPVGANSRKPMLDTCTTLPEPDPTTGLHSNTEKGGYKVTTYLTIDSLYSEKVEFQKPENADSESESDDETTVSDSLNLALRLRKQFERAYDIAQLQSDSVEEQRQSSTDDPNDSSLPTCDHCGQRLPTGVSLQTALLRHEKVCGEMKHSPS